MSNLLRRLKFLPWRSLIQVSLLTIVITLVLDFLIALGYFQSALIQSALNSPLAVIFAAAAGAGMGALAVYLLELQRQVMINTSTLWALIFCLVLGLVLKALLRLPAILVGLDDIQLIMIVVGVFWKGRPYWR